MKKIGFLSFGHWTPSPQSQARSAADVLLQSIDLAMEAERLGMDGAYGFNRTGAKVSQGVIQNWWRQGMMGGALAQYEGIKAFSETDQTDDLKAITVPTLVMQGDDDQIVPYKDASFLQAKLLKHGTLKIYPGFPHGMMTTHADVINADLLAFIRS